MNNNEPPQKSPPNWGKQAFSTLLKQCHTHQKQIFWILKPQKTNPQNTILPCSKNKPTIFHKFSFLTYSFCFWKAVLCWKHYKIVFQENTAFKNTVSKTHFFNHVKKHLFPKRGVIVAFFAISAESHYFYSVSCFTLFWSKKILAKTDCARKCVFLPSWHK